MQAAVRELSIDDLCRRGRSYLNGDQIKKIRAAYRISSQAHDGQMRKSGEPYIQHPIEVASILASMRMDHETLMAAILHDVIEDTSLNKEEINREFGSEVADIVDGLSKLTQIEFETHAEAQAENFQKMLMAMADDIRVILVKLADRLHNMRTLGALASEKRRRIARETLDIYAPIAQRLGMNTIRLELEELGFEALYPLRYGVLRNVIDKIRGNRKEVVSKIKNRIKRRIRQEQLVGHVIGREKHLYSIYRKMKEKNLHFSEVHDVYAFRITVDSVDTCYRMLGVVHALYKPVPGTFKDYIAIPKINGYQSLHTVLFGPFGVPVEVQIRTNEMDQVAEAGVAAHWLYKSGDAVAKSAHKRARDWLTGVLELQRKAGDSQEFLEHVKIDLFPDEVYVFTPKGEIMEMPRGATAVDFAYAIHTDLGNTCVGCRIDRRLAPLRTGLTNGQTVEIVTAPGARPNPGWLNFVVTGKARANIRHFLKNLQSDEARTLGKRMLNRELERFSSHLDKLDPKQVRESLKSFEVDEVETLAEEVGLGVRPAPLVARALVGEKADTVEEKPARHADGPTPGPLLIHGGEGMVVTLPRCCHPIPGDPIMGFLTAGRGIVIHQASCTNVAEFRSDPSRWVDVDWAENIETEFTVELVLQVQNRRGALATVAAAISELGCNIESVDTAERDESNSTMRVLVGVSDRKQLADLLRVLRHTDPVDRVHRKRG
ncbi:MAG: bifunctional (p)ppGpp synthetase/guanosine-3',5'-bis(diphosphate) 3'-pyrophosphohydrolase [Pseudomonadota bacterium]